MNHNQISMNHFWDLSLEILCLVDFENYFQDVNPAFERVLGYTKNEVLGKLFTDFLHPDDLIDSLAEVKLHPLGHIARHFENRYRSKDGSYIWLSWNAFPIVEEKLIYAIGRDITWRKQAEEKLRESEERFSRAFHSNPTGLVISHLDDGTIAEANEGFEHLVGLNHQEIIGHSISDLNIFIDPIQRHEMRQTILNAGKIQHKEVTARTREGNLLHVLLSSDLIQVSQKRMLLTTVFDITALKQAEEALKENEAKLRLMFESINDAVTVTDLNGRIIQCNEATALMHGYASQQKVIGLNALELIAKVDRLRATDGMKRTLERGNIKDVYYSFLKNNGREFPGELSASVIKDKTGNPIGFIAITKDITARKQAEEALKESEERFSQAFQSSPAAFTVTSLRDGTFIDFNEAYQLLTGYSREELIGHTAIELGLWVNPKQREELVRRLKAEGKVYNHDVEVRTKNGRSVNVLFSMEIIHLHGKDFALAAALDITERKQAEDALARTKENLEIEVKERTAELEESEGKYRKVVENANELIVVFQEGVIRFVNNQGLKITGYSRKHLLSRPFTDFIHPDDRATMAERARRRVLGKAEARNYEFRIIHKDGSTKWLAANAVLIPWQGKPATLALMSDITSRKNMEDELKNYAQKITQVQEEERKRIAYELHDDTAQYLAILKLEIDSIIQSGKIMSPEILEKLKYLEKDAGRAVDDVRRYSHELRPGVLEHLGLVAALEQIIEDINKLKQLTVELTVEGEEKPLSEDVKLGFFRIAQEALNNCRKHSKALEANVILRFRENKLEMVISDNGIGFDIQEARGRTRFRGSLGLISMQERAKLIGANLKMESKPGKGTTVKLETPLEV